MPAIRTIATWHSSTSNLRICPACRLYGPLFTESGLAHERDIEELQSIPTTPSFISRVFPTSNLLSTFDLDSVSAFATETEERNSKANGVIALRAVLSSILLSPSFSPVERAHVLDDCRSPFAETYNIDSTDFNRVLSEPLLSLGGMSPLLHEIMRWDPIWESADDTGAASTGMEAIQFFIENWQYIPEQPDDQAGENEEDSSETTRTRRQLMGIVRNASLRRLLTLTPPASHADEDTANKLYQRLLHLVYAHNSGKENESLADGRRARYEQYVEDHTVADYNISVAYSSQLQGRKGKLVRQPHAVSCVEDAEFNALISITHFDSSLRDAIRGNTSIRTASCPVSGKTPPSPAPTPTRRSRTYRPGIHPYRSSRISNTTAPNVSLTNVMRTPANADLDTSSASRSMLRVEFLAAQRAWALSVGRDALELTILGGMPNHFCGLSGDIESNAVSAESEAAIYAEVRLVSPSPAHGDSESKIMEHVFTFPAMRTSFSPLVSSTSTSPDPKRPSHAKQTTMRLAPCFWRPPTPSKAGAEKGQTVVRFDDARILHEGELLLELRVRISSAASSVSHPCPSPPLSSILPAFPPSADSCSNISRPASRVTDSELDEWGVLHAPSPSPSVSTSLPASSLISVPSSDVFSSSVAQDLQDSLGSASESSWVAIK